MNLPAQATWRHAPLPQTHGTLEMELDAQKLAPAQVSKYPCRPTRPEVAAARWPPDYERWQNTKHKAPVLRRSAHHQESRRCVTVGAPPFAKLDPHHLRSLHSRPRMQTMRASTRRPQESAARKAPRLNAQGEHRNTAPSRAEHHRRNRRPLKTPASLRPTEGIGCPTGGVPLDEATRRSRYPGVDG